jgi:hypothetical protein
VIVLQAIGLAGLVAAVFWLIGLAGEEDEEESAGFVTANWDEIKTWIGRR